MTPEERFLEHLRKEARSTFGISSPFSTVPGRAHEIWISAEYGEREEVTENDFDLRILIQKRIYEGKIK